MPAPPRGIRKATARALGLLRGDANLREAGNTLFRRRDPGLLRRRHQRVEVRGADLTVGRRVTIVHELTHALQDQYFDLSRQDESDSDDRNAAFEAVVEGRRRAHRERLRRRAAEGRPGGL